MTDVKQNGLSRRSLLERGGVAAGGLMAAGLVDVGAAHAAAGAKAGRLPVAAIERIVDAKGSVSGGVLNIELEPRTSAMSRGRAGSPSRRASRSTGTSSSSRWPAATRS